MKSVPTFKCGDFKIRYVQVMYDNRYFVFSYYKRHCRQKRVQYIDFAKISCSDAQLLNELSTMVIRNGMDSKTDTIELADRFRRYDKFSSRVKAKDKWLDRTYEND